MFEGFADWLAKITWPLVSRVFASIGVGSVTYVGADTALGNALSAAGSAIHSVGGGVLAILVRAGMFDVFSILSGGLTSALAWMVLKRWALFTGSDSQGQAA